MPRQLAGNRLTIYLDDTVCQLLLETCKAIERNPSWLVQRLIETYAGAVRRNFVEHQKAHG